MGNWQVSFFGTDEASSCPGELNCPIAINTKVKKKRKQDRDGEGRLMRSGDKERCFPGGTIGEEDD